ncbi:MAG: DUF1214 domain-containing protein [Burkholderiaceae bacterium]|nr:DUF1214 domain-containing protein [Burkholderiaceae bacterium]
MGNFGTNRRLRALVALRGLAALDADEVVYFNYADPLTGEHRYRLRMPAGGLACDAFWSVTMYRIEADGRRFLLENPIGRYLINDRTPGLRRSADGSLTIAIQVERPAASDDAANWLPAPIGECSMVLRAYHPRAELRGDHPVLPTLERID